MTSGDLFRDVRQAGVLWVAEALGLEVAHRGSDTSFACPSCGKVRRHTRDASDLRRAARIVHEGGGWWCEACGARGDGVSLLAAVVTGRVDGLGAEDWRRVRERAVQLSLCRATSTPPAPPRSDASPTYRRPPANEVQALWKSTQPIGDSLEATERLKGRGIDVSRVEERNLSRVLPAGASLPGCASHWGNEYRLLFPMYGASGQLESLRARPARQRSTSEGKKALPARGDGRGLVMADPLARLWLAGEPLGDGTPSADLVRKVGLWIAEGEPDFLSLSCAWGDDDAAPAVVGVVAGSWTQAIAARVPAGTRVAIATDPDDAGNKYAAEIASTLQGRAAVSRWQAPPEREVA